MQPPKIKQRHVAHSSDRYITKPFACFALVNTGIGQRPKRQRGLCAERAEKVMPLHKDERPRLGGCIVCSNRISQGIRTHRRSVLLIPVSSMLQKRRGHNTRMAFTGEEAVAIAVNFLLEVVLLDIGLPSMDGFEVARPLRAMLALAHPLLIAMSGYGREEDREQAQTGRLSSDSRVARTAGKHP